MRQVFERGNWLVEVIEEWSQFAPGYNWRTFHPIQLEFEDDRIMGGVEATAVVLGLGIRVRWNYTMTDTMAEVIRRKDEIDLDPSKAVPVDIPGLNK